jgi:alpha-1,3-rhamnosyl/mannosyltransferase
MHIVLDCRSIHSHMGGIGKAAWGLAEELGRHPRRHRITLIVGEHLPPEFRIRNVELVQVEAAMIDEHFEQLGLPALLEDMNVDVYANTTFSIPALKTSPKQVAFIHDVVFEDHPEWVEPKLREYLSRWSRFSASHADRVVTVSKHAGNRIAEVYDIDHRRIRVIYNGLTPESRSSPSPDRIAHARREQSLSMPYILYIGSIEPKKGIPELLEAFSRLSREESNIDLALVGGAGGPAFDLHAAILKTGCPDRVRRLGYLPEEEKRALLAGSALFVYPSHYEGFGLPPLEAMALGVPCVVNDATSLPEVVGAHALRVDVRDAERFAATLSRGLHDEAFRARAGLLAPRWAKKFTWQRAAGRFLDLCEELGK